MLPFTPQTLWVPPKPKVVAAAGAAYVFRSSLGWSDATDSKTLTVDIGTASSDRLVIVAIGDFGTHATNSVTVNGVSLTRQVQNTPAGFTAAIYSDLVTSGSGNQSVVISFTGSAFEDRGMTLWTATGLSSSTPADKNATDVPSTGPTISVTAGGFLFAYNTGTGAENFTGSTQAPSRQDSTVVGGGGVDSSADWTIAATNAAFAVVSSNANDGPVVAASYH